MRDDSAYGAAGSTPIWARGSPAPMPRCSTSGEFPCSPDSMWFRPFPAALPAPNGSAYRNCQDFALDAWAEGAAAIALCHAPCS
jgi:hypothetical protein